jgi:hypothetical protein
MPTIRNTTLTLTTGFLLVALCGCAGDGRKPTYAVRGQVFDAKKKPATGALVVFHPVTADANHPARPSATVDAEGNYALTTYVTGDGAPAGEYAITIVWPPPRKSPFEPAGGDQLQGKLSRPENSPHKFTVESKPDQVVPAITLP